MLRTAFQLGRSALPVLLALVSAVCDRSAQPPRLIVGATHTLEDSGLLDELRTAYVREYGDQDDIAIIVAGSGQVLELARQGDVDVIVAHSPDAELALMQDGIGESREPVMHNEFVVLGPPDDPAGARSATSPFEAFRRISASGGPFVSRADDSGTHRRELAIWDSVGTRPAQGSYIEAGTGMADALRLASQRGAYILADRATFAVLRDGLDLDVIHERHPLLLNPYSVIVVANATNLDGARRFAQWIRGPDARRLIGEYGQDTYALPLFVADTTASH